MPSLSLPAKLRYTIHDRVLANHATAPQPCGNKQQTLFLASDWRVTFEQSASMTSFDLNPCSHREERNLTMKSYTLRFIVINKRPFTEICGCLYTKSNVFSEGVVALRLFRGLSNVSRVVKAAVILPISLTSLHIRTLSIIKGLGLTLIPEDQLTAQPGSSRAS